MSGHCLCGTTLPAEDHPVTDVMGFTMIECPSAPPGEMWMFNPKYVQRYPPDRADNGW